MKTYFEELAKRTIISENIIFGDDGYFRYVNHTDQLATTGFKTEESLLKWSDAIRFDLNTIKRMNERYLLLSDWWQIIKE